MNRRERQHENIREEVKTIARQHMASQGTAAISLRAIARDMELSPQALYRYFPSRDDLITALILDAFNSHGASIRQAVAQAPADDALAGLLAFLMGYREWALSHPVDFQLIYGNPIPEYHAPVESTSRAAENAMEMGIVMLDRAIEQRVLIPPAEYIDIPPTILAAIETQRAHHRYPFSATVLYLAMMAWGQMHGLVMLEMFGHSQPTLGDTAAFYKHQMLDLIRRMGGRMPSTVV